MPADRLLIVFIAPPWERLGHLRGPRLARYYTTPSEIIDLLAQRFPNQCSLPNRCTKRSPPAHWLRWRLASISRGCVSVVSTPRAITTGCCWAPAAGL